MKMSDPQETLDDLQFALTSENPEVANSAMRLLLACMVVRTGGAIIDASLLSQVRSDLTGINFEVLRSGGLAVTLQKN